MVKQCQTLFFWAPKSLQMVTQSNINVQELIQESANKSYNLAIEICEGGVENNITRHGMTELASEWYKAKKHFIEMFGGKTSVEIVVEGEFEERVGKEMLYEYMERMLKGNFVYKPPPRILLSGIHLG